MRSVRVMSNENMKAAVPLQIRTEEDFPGIVEALCSRKNGSAAGIKKRWKEQELPSRHKIGEIIESLRSSFPDISVFPNLRRKASGTMSDRPWTISGAIYRNRSNGGSVLPARKVRDVWPSATTRRVN
jgi:hypothetical protein